MCDEVGQRVGSQVKSQLSWLFWTVTCASCNVVEFELVDSGNFPPKLLVSSCKVPHDDCTATSIRKRVCMAWSIYIGAREVTISTSPPRIMITHYPNPNPRLFSP